MLQKTKKKISLSLSLSLSLSIYAKQPHVEYDNERYTLFLLKKKRILKVRHLLTILSAVFSFFVYNKVRPLSFHGFLSSSGIARKFFIFIESSFMTSPSKNSNKISQREERERERDRERCLHSTEILPIQKNEDDISDVCGDVVRHSQSLVEPKPQEHELASIESRLYVFLFFQEFTLTQIS